jgi:hypothetical protein
VYHTFLSVWYLVEEFFKYAAVGSEKNLNHEEAKNTKVHEGYVNTVGVD